MKQILDKEKINRIPWTVVGVIFVAIIAAITVIIAAVGRWQSGMLSICALLLIVFASILIIRREMKKNMQAVLEAQRIEAEKRAMELKLQETQISIMLSQIQPHFLYNTLNSIYQLCETNPMRAKFMVNSFAEYLRNNLSSLEETGLISFETELSHIKTYLDIEKVRFEDTLEIEYDINCESFSLPVLTVQPIVENAVKHGTSKKRGGGKVIISTREDDKNYIITVSDTGCGFDLNKPKNDGKMHVGIENVRQRLTNMCNGSLTIESEIGVGTVVTIKIPKGERK
jgi:sensor histidine kinase YesM